MRTLRIEESGSGAVVEITPEQATALAKAGRSLASNAQWWGSDADDSDTERSVISVEPVSVDRYRVRVADAVGLVSLGDLQIEVTPKIKSLSHLVYLLGHSEALPRLDEHRGAAGEAESLWELVAGWFLRRAEELVRKDLVRGYEERTDELRIVRGRLRVLDATRNYYSGALQMPCEYEEFDIDTPLNRIIRAATAAVAGESSLTRDHRHRAMSLLTRMAGVGPLRESDMRHRPGRSTAHYADALVLARHILRGRGRAPVAGRALAWTFLFRTPELAEAGIRQVLADRLHPRGHSVVAQGVQIARTSLTFNPDLVFDHGSATGDVKYKVTQKDWRRGDLYQAIAFATAFHANRACVIGFDLPGCQRPPSLRVGNIDVSYFGWNADPHVSPEVAADQLASEVHAWLEGTAQLSIPA